MEVYDADGSGSLDFEEFVVMVCTSDQFKFKFDNSERQFALESLPLMVC